MKTNKSRSKILTREELQWFGQWLSKSQIEEGIKSHPGASHSVIFNVLQSARSRVEAGLPPYGSLGRTYHGREDEVDRSLQEASGVLQDLKPNASSKRLPVSAAPF